MIIIILIVIIVTIVIIVIILIKLVLVRTTCDVRRAVCGMHLLGVEVQQTGVSEPSAAFVRKMFHLLLKSEVGCLNC